MSPSKIEWTNETWNPSTGCTKVSPGCAHCYAEELTKRYAGTNGWPAEFKPWVPGNDTVVLHPDRLEKPLTWKTPRMVFVNSMSDLFHEDIPDEFIDQVFAVMALTPQHTYQVLTKRPQRMREYMTAQRIAYFADGQPVPKDYESGSFVLWAAQNMGGDISGDTMEWPLPNVWLGVTVENQRWADERIPLLLDTPAAIRFISAEPLLGPLNLRGRSASERDLCIRCGQPESSHGKFWVQDAGNYHEYRRRGLNWVIVGGESGPKHRPFNPDWARSIVAQCREAGVAAFVKQLGGARPGNKLEDLPPDLRVREFPA